MTLTIERFLGIVETERLGNPNKRHWRYGQALFNILYEFRPALADQIRATSLDPFYTEDEDKITRSLLWIEQHWGDEVA